MINEIKQCIDGYLNNRKPACLMIGTVVSDGVKLSEKLTLPMEMVYGNLKDYVSAGQQVRLFRDDGGHAYYILEIIGYKGDVGAPGPQGPAGPQGEKGDTGAVGPKGDKGNTGPAGPQGATGAAGATGATGAQGPKGADGLTTSVGVNGTTYTQSGGKITLPNLAASAGKGNVDLNTLTTSGFYRVDCPTNGPGSIDYGQVIVAQGGGDTCLQIAADFGSGHLFWRSGNTINNSSGTWGAWKQITST